MADTRRDDDRCEHGFAPEACLVCEIERWAERVRELCAEVGRLRAENAILRAGVVVAIDAGHDAERALARANGEE